MTGRRANKVDANHDEVVTALRKEGYLVQSLAPIGGGVPDLLVGATKANGERVRVLLEVKDGSKPKSRWALTPDQKLWHELWTGHAYVVKSVEEALAVVAKARAA